ncbi:putative aspartyl protease [Salinibacter ruber]|jgi:predicted aspartyl protease|uniref:hypothetical protein n=1 Tax=Salinibacter ruber TaxID=146919 RepID=UPI000DD7D837|nr:hypothetical protein [Salinibacter ruber]MCS3629077.1 putative aspartyl protease [Salinibacter ruber]MCS3668132.1 putative aspartyl protease [Salinibacter ruber]MCS3685538.1 putative aspartyl protease [Salinibacter ruber]MCS3708270.1 putative aspartyl protease [Salinibacter ruber]MCS3827881.1 putative aspartyl protease [Salinibacter ruber]
MKIGTIDANGKALVPLTVERLGSEGKRREVTALLDTVFSGFLALPPELIDVLGSEQLSREQYMTASGALHFTVLSRAREEHSKSTRFAAQ